MRPVAARLLAGLLAAAERERLALFSLELDRAEPGALVRAIAERLLATLAARAPPIGLAGLDIDPIRAFLRAQRQSLGHHILPSHHAAPAP